jgi:H+/Cl- antiporter ClcA
MAAVASPRYLGLGVETIEAAARGAWVPAEAFALKILFTAVSFGAGGSGGVVTPILFIGATGGSVLAGVLGLDRGTAAAIGMVSLLAGAANTPLAASIMAIELFGPEVGPFAAVSCVVSFLMAGHRSVFESQILITRKAAAVRAREGAPVGRQEPMRPLRPRFRRLRLARDVVAKAVRRLRRR